MLRRDLQGNERGNCEEHAGGFPRTRIKNYGEQDYEACLP